jgi:glutaminyl-peptide cyclotransferase
MHMGGAQDAFVTPTVVGERAFRTFVATHDATAPRKLVLGAHYDSKLLSPGPFVGATDSAVPCALLLALATHLNAHLAQRQRRRDTTLQLVFFDGEEAFQTWTDTDSLYGARHLAAAWAATPSSLRQPNGTGTLRWSRGAGVLCLIVVCACVPDARARVYVRV